MLVVFQVVFISLECGEYYIFCSWIVCLFHRVICSAAGECWSQRLCGEVQICEEVIIPIKYILILTASVTLNDHCRG